MISTSKMTAFKQAKAYSMEQAEKLNKLTLNEFFTYIHSNYYPDQDISFMNYFLEICDKEGQFVVEHTKLVEYGVMTSTRSNKVKEKLELLNLENEEDFNLHDIVQVRENRGTVIKKIYTLTPEAFKKCLMRARKYKDQPIDPVIYCDYYLLLEKVFKLFTDYERAYSNKLLSMKDDKIDKLSDQLKEQSDQLKEQYDQLKEQSDQMMYMQRQNNFIISQNVSLHTKVDSIFDMMLSFMRATIPTWVGGSVMKNQLDILSKNHTTSKALTRLKVLFVVAFHVPYEESFASQREFDDKIIKFNVKSNMIVYFCCTNFAGVGPRIKLLEKRHGTSMYMLKPQAISLLSCEVNMERTFLEKLNIFPERSFPKWSSKYKAFELDIPYLKKDNIQRLLNNIALEASNSKFQGYQMRMDAYNKSTKPKLDPKIIVYLGNVDKGFFESSRPLAQLFIDSYVAEARNNKNKIDHYKYTLFDKTKIPRTDFNNREFHNPGYALNKIKKVIKSFDERDVINEMVATGIVTKADVPAINAFAQYEGIDTSEFQFPDSDSE